MFKCREYPLTRTKRMESRVWKVGEKFSTYFQDKVKLLNKLNMSEELSIEYTIEGIHDYLLKSHARARNYTTLIKLLDGMQRITKNEPRRDLKKNMVTKQYGMDFPKSPRGMEHTGEESKPSGSMLPRPRCYKCHEFGHMASDCKNPPKERALNAQNLDI